MKPILVHGDGFAGLKEFAKFKGIIVTCGAPNVPIELLNQLEIGGKLVIPITGQNNMQRMNVVTKISDVDFDRSVFGSFSFVPMLEGVVK